MTPSPTPVPATLSSLVQQFRAAGIRPGEALIVHSSMKSLGPVEGGPRTVVDALLEAIGPEGTLLMPTFSSPQPDGVFDVAKTPSRVGLITEVFRTTPGVQRSWHPTHAVSAAGGHVEWLEDHHKTSGLGSQSPLHRAGMNGAKVLMLGCPMTSCSIVHVAEALARVPYLGRVWYPDYERTLVVATPAGDRLTIPPLDPPTCSNAFGAVERELQARNQIHRPRIAEADSLLFTGADALAAAGSLLTRNTAALLCASPRCLVCAGARKVIEGNAVTS